MAKAKHTPTRSARRVLPCRWRKPFFLPSVFSGHVRHNLESYWRYAANAAWHGGREVPCVTRVKAAREDIARWHLLPVELVELVRMLAAYDAPPWPNDTEGAKPVEWLRDDRGPFVRENARIGTYKEARRAALDVRSAALSILMEVPIERTEDETTVLETLQYAGWRFLPQHQRERASKRMSRHVARLITGELGVWGPL